MSNANQPDNHDYDDENRKPEPRPRKPNLTVVQHGDWTAHVHPAVAPLMIEIWKAGIVTIDSQPEPRIGWVQLEFMTPRDARKFVNLVARYDANPFGIYNRIRGDRVANDAEQEVHGRWEFGLHPCDIAIEQDEGNEHVAGERTTGPVDFQFAVSIAFPISDTPTLVQRLREFNRPHRQELDE